MYNQDHHPKIPTKAPIIDGQKKTQASVLGPRVYTCGQKPIPEVLPPPGLKNAVTEVPHPDLPHTVSRYLRVDYPHVLRGDRRGRHRLTLEAQS